MDQTITVIGLLLLILTLLALLHYGLHNITDQDLIEFDHDEIIDKLFRDLGD